MARSAKSSIARPRVLDLFAGAGGMALGFRAAGARSIGAAEIDPVAAATFAHAFAEDEPVVLGGPRKGRSPGGDLTRIDPAELLRQLPEAPDIVVGGPPCQSFSLIGRAKLRSLVEDAGADSPPRNELFQVFLDVVVAARPKAFVMENVPAVRGSLGVDMAKRIAEDAERRSGRAYEVRYFLLNAAWYGVPQSRWRVFFVGLRRDLGPGAIPVPPVRTYESEGDYPEGISLPDDARMVPGHGIRRARKSLPQVTVREALGDLPRLVSDRGERPALSDRLALRRAPSAWARALRRWPGCPAPDTVSGNWYRNTPRDFEIFRRMAHLDRYPEALSIAEEIFREKLEGLGDDSPAPGSAEYDKLRASCIPPYRNDGFFDKWAKLAPDRPSWTLTAHLSKDTYSHIHYDSNQARTITVREAARLQSFPDGFEFCGSPGDQYRQIGNAVPPLLARAIASTLIRQIETLECTARRRAAG